jgi:hypothetical protein
VAAPAGTADVVHAGVQASDVPLAAPAATATAQKSADATEEALRRKVEDLKRDGATVESASTEITTGGPAYPITEFARDTGADLIVVGTSGSSQLVRLLVGSVTRRLLELALSCPGGSARGLGASGAGMEIHHDSWRRPWTGWTKPAMRCAATAGAG